MLLDKFKKTIRAHNLISKQDRILIGVSGGPDSLTLLFLLNNLKKEYGLTLYVAHLDHMLRADSCRDKKFVENLARKLRLPVFSKKVDINKLAQKGGSIEDIARKERLKFFFAAAKAKRANKIALGHNLDDQAETVLMRLIRGTGLYGLSGILPKREICGFQIIRPLIEIRRSEIETFLKKKRVRPCRDSSNQEEIFFRNKIRIKLMPILEKQYNRNIKAMFSNLAESVALDYDYLSRIAQKTAARLGKKISLKKFLKLHPAIQRLILRLNFARLKGDTRRITFQHIREIEDLIFWRPVNSIVDLPKGISVAKKKDSLVFFHR